MPSTLMWFIAAVIVFASASVASAQEWAAAGVTGSIDEADTSIYRFNDTGSVSIKGSVARATLQVRYRVDSMPAIFNPPGVDCTELRANLRDTGAGARVIIRVFRLGIGGEASTGELTKLGEIDSDRQPNPPPSTRYLSYRACLSEGPGATDDYTFFVEAQLIKTTATANPGLLSLQICSSQDACDP